MLRLIILPNSQGYSKVALVVLVASDIRGMPRAPNHHRLKVRQHVRLIGSCSTSTVDINLRSETIEPLSYWIRTA